MSAANEAAAGLTGELVSELVEKVPHTEELGIDVLALELAQAKGGTVEAAVEPSSTEAAVAQEEQETAEFDLPNYTPDIPEDLLADLDEPDFEAEAEAEVSDEEYLYDEGDSEERKLRIAAEKRAAHLEERLQTQSRVKWEAEAKKFFPLAERSLSTIKATSRRAFLREAKAKHEEVLPYLKPYLDKLDEVAEQTKAQAREEGKQEARTAWGDPGTGPGVVPVRASAEIAELEDARRSGVPLSKRLGIIMRQGR